MSMTDNLASTEELVNEIKQQIEEEQQEIKENFTKLGTVYYERHKEDESSEFSELCKEISGQYEEIEHMNQRIIELTTIPDEEAKICPNCGSKNEKDSLFCGECGHKLPDEHSCPQCGAHIEEGDKFCRSCGCKLEAEETEIQEETPQPKVCKNCGKPLEEGAAFCIYCGTKNS